MLSGVPRDEVDALRENLDAEQLVITSDHGQAFGEWKVYCHPCRVPINASCTVGGKLPCQRRSIRIRQILRWNRDRTRKRLLKKNCEQLDIESNPSIGMVVSRPTHMLTIRTALTIGDCSGDVTPLDRPTLPWALATSKRTACSNALSDGNVTSSANAPASRNAT